MMEPFAPRRILVGTDFSDLATWALRHAVMWARRCGSELAVLHVQEPPPFWSDPYLGAQNLTGLVEQVWEATNRRLQEYVRQHVPTDIAATPELMAGSAPRVIEEYAAGSDCDLVVLGTHGRGGISRVLLGSVAERALRMAHQPTLIVRQVTGQERLQPEDLHLRHILCPVNDTAVARVAFEHAYEVTRTFGARLTAALVAEPEAEPEMAGMLRRLEETLHSWIPGEAEFQLQPIVRRGDPAEEVITLAREVAADLVVIGAQHRRFVDSTVLGVTTVRVTRHAHCPVLVVPRAGDAS